MLSFLAAIVESGAIPLYVITAPEVFEPTPPPPRTPIKSTADCILTKFTNAQKAQASMRYRDALARYLRVAKALRLLRGVENLEGAADRAMRTQFEARFQRLTDRLGVRATAIKGF